MPRIRKEVEVEGIGYSICEIAPTKASLILLKLMKVFGPVFGKLYSSSDITSLEGIKDTAKTANDLPLEEILTIVADRMDEEELLSISLDLLNQTYPLGNPQMLLGTREKYDIYFSDVDAGVLHQFKLLKEVLQLQYADFFAGLSIPESIKAPQHTKSPLVP